MDLFLLVFACCVLLDAVFIAGGFLVVMYLTYTQAKQARQIHLRETDE